MFHCKDQEKTSLTRNGAISASQQGDFPAHAFTVPIEGARELHYNSPPMRTEANLGQKFIHLRSRFKRIISSETTSKQSLKKRNFGPRLLDQHPNSINFVFNLNLLIAVLVISAFASNHALAAAQVFDSSTAGSQAGLSEPDQQPSTNGASCFGGLQTFEKISMSTFENPSASSGSVGSSFGSGILIQQDDQALTSECVNLCRSQSNCLSFVIDYNKFECKSYATTQQELQQEFDAKHMAARSVNGSISNGTATDQNGYQASASTTHFQHLLPSASSNYFEKICLDGVANRNQFNEVCGQGRLWTVERVVDSFLDGYVEKEVTNVNNKDECSKLCIFETQFVCRSADYDQHSRLCRLSKEDRRTQPQAMRYNAGSNRQYLENQCATPGPSSCVYETKKNVGIISMDALKFAQTIQDCQMKCNQESTFNCRSYSFHQQRCFLSGDDSSSFNSNLIKLPVKQGWQFGEKKCLIELCTKGVFSYEKITGYTLRSALSTPIDLMMPSGSHLSMAIVGNNLDDLEKLQHESSQTKLRHLLPIFHPRSSNLSNPSIVSQMMMVAANSKHVNAPNDPLLESDSSLRQQRSTSNLAITNHCRHSCNLGYLNCPAFTIDYKNNRCQRLDRNSQGRHQELVAREGFAYYEKICLRVPEIMTMCQDKYWIFERVIGYELAPRLYEKSLKFVQSRRDCEEYCLEERQFQCRSALYNDETSDCKLSRYDRRLATQEGAYYRNFNIRISYLENQCIRDHGEKQQCFYEQARDEPAYPTFTEHVEMVPPPLLDTDSSNRQQGSANLTLIPQRYGSSYCEQLCNENSKFECHSFGYYASTAQCFLSGDDTISAGESTATSSTGFTYYEKKCRLMPANHTEESPPRDSPPKEMPEIDTGSGGNPYFQPNLGNHINRSNTSSTTTTTISETNQPTLDKNKPAISNNNISIHIEQQLNMRPASNKPQIDQANTNGINPDQYKCGHGHTFVYQRISGFEPIGGYLTLLIKNNELPGIVHDCSELCKKAYECRAFVVDYNNNQCFAMLENSSVGMLSLRQTLGKDYFEGFCVADHILLSGSHCRNKTWILDKIVDQAVIGVQHQKLIQDMDRVQCRQACLEERLFWCKSAMFDGATGDCKLYSVDRESMPQMRLLFTKGVDFYENQCQISSSSCPYDAIERDMIIVTMTKTVQARSTFDCELACNNEITFNCRSYTYMDQYPSLPNMCILSSDSRSTSQKGSVREHRRTLYAERNCYYRRPRYPGGSSQKQDSIYSPGPPTVQEDPYQMLASPGRPAQIGHPVSSDPYAPSQLPADIGGVSNPTADISGPILGQGCEPHQYTFERTFGFDFRLGSKERAPIAPTIGIAIACQQECLRRADRCQSFVVEYSLPYQSCFLIETQVGSNKKLLVKSPNSAYFEKVCLPRTGVESEPVNAQLNGGNQLEINGMDIAPSYSNEPWSPQAPNQLPFYLQHLQLVQNYPSRSCAKLWTFERFVNHNFTAPSDKTIENILTKGHCETQCLNEASFTCRAATYDYSNRICRLFKNTRRTIMSQFVNLDSTMATSSASSHSQSHASDSLANSQPGTAHVINPEVEPIQAAQSTISDSSVSTDANKRQRQLSLNSPTTADAPKDKNIDYLENICTPEPSSCQYRQLYDQFSPYIDKINHAVSLSDCQRQCDLERLFTCKSINYDPSSRNCMLINEDLISLDRGQQASLLPKKNTIYSEKGNCEMISVQCNSQEMLVSINFDAPFRGRVMAKGNPEKCFLIGDGQTSLQFPIVFGPKCNSRQEGHNTFVNEVIIQQHPVIMTDSDKTVRVMCAFEAPDQTITLKNPSSRDNKTGIDVGTPESSRTRHDKQHFNSVVSNKAPPPSVLLRILDLNGRDASMINLGDDLILKIQMQMDGQNSALGIFARNLAARSSNGETLLLIDNDGCPVDHQVFPALEIDPKDGKSLFSIFKAFRFPSSGLVNFEVQIRFCPERCQPVDCHKGHKTKSYGRKKRDLTGDGLSTMARMSVIQSINHKPDNINPLDGLSTVMKPGKAFQYVRELMLSPPQQTEGTMPIGQTVNPLQDEKHEEEATELSTENLSDSGKQPDVSEQNPTNNLAPSTQSSGTNDTPETLGANPEQESPSHSVTTGIELVHNNSDGQEPSAQVENVSPNGESELQSSFQKSILMHVDEKVVPNTGYMHSRGLGQHHSAAPYGSYPLSDIELHHKRLNMQPELQAPAMATENALEQSPGVLIDESAQHDQSAPDSSRLATEQSLNRQQESSFINESSHKPNKSPEMLEASSINGENPKDVPLRFSILVGENQAASRGWSPSGPAPVFVMNSSNVDLDHIVIPGREGLLDSSPSSDSPRSQINTRFMGAAQSPQLNSATTQSSFMDTRPISDNPTESVKGNTLYEQTFDVLPSNSVAAEIAINQSSSQFETINKSRQNVGSSESAASHDCQIDSGNSRLWTIIWTGTFVIALNVCLVVLSLVLYFKKVHLRQHHNIMRATSESGTGISSGLRWPSVLLKSKNNLGTSLNTHEHFFCKLNSKPNGPGGSHEFNWPNLSASSSHSTISSMASPLPMTNIRINQTRAHQLPFDSQFSQGNNFTTGHKSILDINSYDDNGSSSSNLHASYTNNIDETHPGGFQPTMRR